jgi:hypothetical protein
MYHVQQYLASNYPFKIVFPLKLVMTESLLQSGSEIVGTTGFLGFFFCQQRVEVLLGDTHTLIPTTWGLYWSLNSGLHACKASTLLREPHLQSTLF